MGKRTTGLPNISLMVTCPPPGIQEPGIQIDILTQLFLDLHLIRERIYVSPAAHDHGIMVMVRIRQDHRRMTVMDMNGMILSGIFRKTDTGTASNRQKTHPVMARPAVKHRSAVFL